MLGIIFRILNCLNKKQKTRFIFLQIANILSAILNTFATVLFAPFVAIVANPEIVSENKYFIYFFQLFNISPNDNVLAIFSILLASLFALSIITILILTYLNLRWSADLSIYFHRILFKYYIHKDWTFHSFNSSSSLVSKVHTDTERLNSTVIIPFMDMLTNSMMALFIFFAILIVSLKTALISFFIFGLAYILFFIYFNKSLKEIGVNLSKSYPKFYKALFEGFGAIRDTILFKKRDFFNNKFATEVKEINILGVKEQFIAKLPRSIIEIIAIIFIILTIFYLIEIYNFEFVELSSLMAFYAICIIKVIPALQKIFNSYSQINIHISAFNNIEKDLINAKQIEKKKFETEIGDTSLKINFKANIKLTKVSYNYSDREKAGVFNVDMEIPHGKKIGIAGKTGSGKSTLADLILGLLKPDSGSIFVDGLDINKSEITSWQNNLTYVPQNFYLLDDSIRNNIAYGVEEKNINDEKIEICLKLARLKEFIDKKNIILGERGVKISGGQKQRIAIARALYKDAETMIMDEATSSLDIITEREIMKSLNDVKKIKTFIIISHRLETLRDCELIYFLADGKVEKIHNITELKKKFHYDELE